ncbi:MAG: IclR family transcriptional regulator [Lautropia sp.]
MTDGTAGEAAAGGGVRALGSVLKAFTVLDEVGRSSVPQRLADLTRAIGESRSTIYQKLVTLIQAGWVETTDDGRYRLSLHAARIGAIALEQASLDERAIVVLRELAQEASETASLAALRRNRAELIQRVEADVAVQARVSVGARMSLDSSSSGRVLTAFATPEVRAALADAGMELASPAILRNVQRTGYAVSAGRDFPGVRSVAAPIYEASGTCVFALSVAAPIERFNEERLARPLLRAAGRLNRLIRG